MVIKMNKVICFIKNEVVLVIACILAVISSFIVTPDHEYIQYIDFRTLGILFCLMAVMAGLQKTGVFTYLAERLTTNVRSARGLMFILIMLCFFFSMLITNDVALITFVPFTITVLRLIKNEKLMIPVVALQTVAANLGSMLTPIGNPQNLYLYGRSGMHLGEFILLMLPYTALSFVLLTISILFCKKKTGVTVKLECNTSIKKDKRLIIYPLLFVLALLSVARILDYRITLIITAVVIAAADKKTLGKIDYSLLVTFIAFFVFIGNMGRIDVFRELLRGIIGGRECVTSVVTSQVVSNVPAALLLSGFTDNIRELIIGTNIGGLGTLIASMASLISFKYVSGSSSASSSKYIALFTAVNIIFLALLLCLYFIIR